MKHFSKLIFPIATIFANSSAFAQAAANETCESSNIDIASLSVVGKHLESSLGPATTLSVFTTEAIAISARLVPFALVLAGIFLLIGILSSVVKSMIENKPIGSALVDHILTGSIVAGLIGSYGFFMNLAVSIAGTLNSFVNGSSPMNAITVFGTRLFAALGNVFNSVFNSFSCVGWIDAITNFIPALIVILLVLVAGIFMILALVEMIFILLLGPITMSVAIAVGPLFVATYSTPFTKPWFDKWLGFLTGSMLIQFVAFVLLEILGTTMNTIATQYTSQTSELLGVALSLAMVSFVMGSIFKQVPGMVNAMIPGSTGVSNAGNVGDKVSSLATGAIGGVASKGVGMASSAMGMGSAAGAVAGAASATAAVSKLLK